MKVASDPDVHLTYCTNIHPGESWPEIRANIADHVTAVKKRVSPSRPFGVGLRIAGTAATELMDPRAREELRALLDDNGLYVFTVNGFPYGSFHGRRVKEEVYRPDWLEPERVAYSESLARLLCDLLPDGIEGSISTVPVGHAPRLRSADADGRATAALLRYAGFLARLRLDTGKTVGLALEPEPDCRLETTSQTVEFFDRFLLSPAAIERHASDAGLSKSDAEASLRRHLGVCLDTCHAAVEFEDPDSAVDRLVAAGIRILKTQLSAGLSIDTADPRAREALAPFAEDVYLHQVVERSKAGLRRFKDLDEALAHTPASESEWRVHFHVPLFREELDSFRTTQPFVGSLIDRQRRDPFCRHLEIETYTWSVLPAAFRDLDVTTAIVREIDWVLSRLVTS